LPIIFNSQMLRTCLEHYFPKPERDWSSLAEPFCKKIYC
jgi:hypothetical protein